MDLEQRLDELEGLGLHRRMRMVSGPQGPRIVLDGKPVLLLCSNNYLGLADHPRVREAAADAAMRWGVGAGAARGASGTMTVHRRLEERPRGLLRSPAPRCCSAPATSPPSGSCRRWPRRAAWSSPTSSTTPRWPTAARWPRPRRRVYRHGDVEHLAALMAAGRGTPMLVVTDSVFSTDGDVAPLEDHRRPRPTHRARLVVDEAPRDRLPRPGRARRGGRGGPRRRGRRDDRLAWQGAGLLRRLRGLRRDDRALPAQRARTLLASSAPPPPAVAGRWPRSSCSTSSPTASRSCRPTPTRCATELAREGFETAGSRTQVVPIVVGDAGLAVRVADAALERGRVRGDAAPADRARRHLAAAAGRDGLPHEGRAARGAPQVLGRAALQAGFRPAAGIPVAATQGVARRYRRGAAPVRRSGSGRRRPSRLTAAAATRPAGSALALGGHLHDRRVDEPLDGRDRRRCRPRRRPAAAPAAPRSARDGRQRGRQRAARGGAACAAETARSAATSMRVASARPGRAATAAKTSPIVAPSTCSSSSQPSGWPTLMITMPPGASRSRASSKNSRVVR